MIYRVTSEPEAWCIGCDCSDTNACHPAVCYWMRTDRDARIGVCSNCGPLLDAWDAGVKAFKAAGRKGDLLKFINAELKR